MDFLEKIPKDRREKVRLLMEDSNLSLKEKCDALYEILDPQSDAMEEIIRHWNTNPSSPFLFLTAMDPEDVNIVHGVILSQKQNKCKNEMIRLMLNGNKLQVKLYWTWKMNLVREVPRNSLDLLPPKIGEQVASLLFEKEYSKAIKLSSEVSAEAGKVLQEWVDMGTNEDIGVWHEFLFSNAQKILQHWDESHTDRGDDAVKIEEKPETLEFVEPLDECHNSCVKETGCKMKKEPQDQALRSYRTEDADSSHLEDSTLETETDSNRSLLSSKTADVNENQPIVKQTNTSVLLSSEYHPHESDWEPKTTKSGKDFSLTAENENIKQYDEDTASMTSKNSGNPVSTPPINATNILLFGPTGVGKTTFINGIGNYLRFNTLNDALKNDVEIRADASFTVTEDKTYKCLSVTVRANTGNNLEEIRGNENLHNVGQSSTQNPAEHLFEWDNEGEKNHVRIIDTPGIFDTRGQARDTVNTKRIFEFVGQFGKIQAICILLKPNEAKFTVEFRQSLDQLFRELNRSAIRNILFCFTNCRTTQYRPGESLVTLRKYLENLRKESGIVIKAEGSNILCFDNDCFRYLCAVQMIPGMYSDELNRMFAEGWKHNVKETETMLQKVVGMTAHSVEDSVAVHRTRLLLPELSRLLGEQSVNQLKLLKQIEENIEEIKLYEGAAHSWEEKLTYEEVQLINVDLKKPRTICTSPRCVVFEQINDREVQPIPIQICCEDCDVPHEDIEKSPEQISRCKVFSEPGVCKKCACPWVTHIQVTSELKRTKQKKPDFEAHERWKKCENAKTEKEFVLKELEQKKQQVGLENSKIGAFVAECEVFLLKNSIKKGKDTYAHHLNSLIEEEVKKYERGGGNMDLAFDLAEMLDDYGSKVKAIIAEIDYHRGAISISALKSRLKELEKMKFSGPTIAQMTSYLHM